MGRTQKDRGALERVGSGRTTDDGHPCLVPQGGLRKVRRRRRSLLPGGPDLRLRYLRGQVRRRERDERAQRHADRREDGRGHRREVREQARLCVAHLFGQGVGDESVMRLRAGNPKKKKCKAKEWMRVRQPGPAPLEEVSSFTSK